MIILTLLTFLTLQAQDAKELWNELEIAMNQRDEDFLDLQAFQNQIKSTPKNSNDFIEQSISSGMAGVKKKETPIRKRKIKESFKAPRSRSR